MLSRTIKHGAACSLLPCLVVNDDVTNLILGTNQACHL
jgi:hypothetical protein